MKKETYTSLKEWFKLAIGVFLCWQGAVAQNPAAIKSKDLTFIPIWKVISNDSLQVMGFQAFGAKERTNSTYAWDFGDGLTDTGAVVAHQYSTEGPFFVHLTISNGTTLSEDSAQISRHQTYAKQLSPPLYGEVSIVQSLDKRLLHLEELSSFDTLSNERLYESVFWDFGDGSTAFGPIVDHPYIQGSHKVTMVKSVFRDNCPPAYLLLACQPQPTLVYLDTFITHIDIPLEPTILPTCTSAFNVKTEGRTVFGKDITHLPDSVGKAVLTWEWGDGTIEPGDSLFHTYINPGKYTIHLTRSVYSNPCFNYPQPCPFSVLLECQSLSIFDIEVPNDSSYSGLTTGLDEGALSHEVVLFPNPAQHVVRLSDQAQTGSWAIYFYDAVGNLAQVFQGQGGMERELDIRHLCNGLYTYSIMSEGNRVSKGKLSISR
jgi:hypothetical protein